jgi:hypothetical protein
MLHRVVQLATSGIQTHDFSRDDTDSKSDYHDHEPDSLDSDYPFGIFKLFLETLHHSSKKMDIGIGQGVRPRN